MYYIALINYGSDFNGYIAMVCCGYVSFSWSLRHTPHTHANHPHPHTHTHTHKHHTHTHTHTHAVGMASDSEDDYEKFDIPKVGNEKELARLYEDRPKPRQKSSLSNSGGSEKNQYSSAKVK